MRRAVLFVLALPVLLLGTVFGKKVRFLTIPVALLGAGFLFLESLDRAPVAAVAGEITPAPAPAAICASSGWITAACCAQTLVSDATVASSVLRSCV